MSSDLDLAYKTRTSCYFRVRLSNDFNKNYYRRVRITTQYCGKQTDSVSNYEESVSAPSSGTSNFASGVLTGLTPYKTYTFFAYAQAKNRTYYLAGEATITMNEGSTSNEFDYGISMARIDQAGPFKVGDRIDITAKIKNHKRDLGPDYKVVLLDRNGKLLDTDFERALDGRQTDNAFLRTVISNDHLRGNRFEYTVKILADEPGWRETDSKDNTKIVEGSVEVPASPLKALIEQYISQNNLSSAQIKGLRKVGEYEKERICLGGASTGSFSYDSKTVIDKFNNGEMLIFLIEGCGTFTNLNNPRHPRGRYGALAVVIKNKQILCIENEASTLPDYPYFITGMPNPANEEPYDTIVDPGVYHAQSGLHFKYQSTIRICSNKYVPSTHGTKSNRLTSRAIGINFHRGFKSDQDLKPTSVGCQLVSYPNGQKFFETIGVVAPGVQIDDGVFKPLDCTVVINRDFFDPNTVLGNN